MKLFALIIFFTMDYHDFDCIIGGHARVRKWPIAAYAFFLRGPSELFRF